MGRSYKGNPKAGSSALFAAVGGVAAVGLVGYFLYRHAKASSPTLPTGKSVEPTEAADSTASPTGKLSPPGGRPPGALATQLVLAQNPPIYTAKPQSGLVLAETVPVYRPQMEIPAPVLPVTVPVYSATPVRVAPKPSIRPTRSIRPAVAIRPVAAISRTIVPAVSRPIYAKTA